MIFSIFATLLAVNLASATNPPTTSSNLNILEQRDCPGFAGNWGCHSENKVCWRRCDGTETNQWCYPGKDGGAGDFISCNSDANCIPENLEEEHGYLACKYGSCDMCGCGC